MSYTLSVKWSKHHWITQAQHVLASPISASTAAKVSLACVTEKCITGSYMHIHVHVYPKHLLTCNSCENICSVQVVQHNTFTISIICEGKQGPQMKLMVHFYKAQHQDLLSSWIGHVRTLYWIRKYTCTFGRKQNKNFCSELSIRCLNKEVRCLGIIGKM